MHKLFYKNKGYNLPLYRLRESRKMTQEEFGELIGVCGHTVMRIESGQEDGKLNFWRSVQKEFGIPNEQMWAYQNGINEEVE